METDEVKKVLFFEGETLKFVIDAPIKSQSQL